MVSYKVLVVRKKKKIPFPQGRKGFPNNLALEEMSNVELHTVSYSDCEKWIL